MKRILSLFLAFLVLCGCGIPAFADTDLDYGDFEDVVEINPGEFPDKVIFSDVSASAYYADAVKWAVENGITSGTDKNHFSPNAGCTRAQAVTFLWRTAGSPKASAPAGFADVGENAYYADAVAWAVENQITNGISETRFAPNQKCTRAQIVTFQHRAAGKPAASIDSSFRDVPATAYYRDAVNWAVENNITNGTGVDKFSPDSTCARGQIVTFLYRAK